MNKRWFAAPILGCTFTLACASCCLLNKPIVPQYRAATQEELGSTHLAILAVKRLSEYSAELQPRFKMESGDAAMDAVLPDTARVQQSTRDAVRAELELALPTTSTTTKSTTSQVAGSQPRSRTTEKTVTSPGDVTDVTAPGAPADRYDKIPSPSAFFDAGLEQDPMLRYLAATALFQEVKLLNTYVNDAAIGPGYEAYIVRLQVAVEPRRHYQPYDTLVTLSLFPVLSNPEKDAPPVSQPKTSADAVGNQGKGRDVRSFARQSALLEALGTGADSGGRDAASRPIKILPLLVTDNLEAAIASRSSQRVREVSLAALAMLSGAGVGAGVSSAMEELSAVLARDFNSLYTISRVTENTLRVHLGAMQIGAENYAMATRTHNVTLLVLVPKDVDNASSAEKKVVTRTVDVFARTMFVDAKTGEQVSACCDVAFQAEAEAALTRHGFTVKAVESVVTAVRRNQLREFNEALRVADDPNDEAAFQRSRALWTDLSDLIASQRYVQLAIDLPDAPMPEVDHEAAPLLTDDGESATRLELADGRDLQRVKDSLVVYVTLPQKDGVADIKLAASSISITPDGRTLTASFPSLAARKLYEPSKDLAQPKVEAIWRPDRKTEEKIVTPKEARYIIGKPATVKPKVEVALDVTRIALNGGDTYDLPILVKYADGIEKKPIALRFTDARIGDVGATALKGKLEWKVDRWEIVDTSAPPYAMKLSLSGIKGSQAVQITVLYDGKPTGDPIKIPVAP